MEQKEGKLRDRALNKAVAEGFTQSPEAEIRFREGAARPDSRELREAHRMVLPNTRCSPSAPGHRGGNSSHDGGVSAQRARSAHKGKLAFPRPP